MRYAILAGAAVVLLMSAACGAYSFPSGTSAQGTVKGQVLLIPCSPVENASNPCSGRPGQDVEIDFIASDGHTVITKTDAKGAYSIQLDAGTWSVKPHAMRVIKGPSTVNADRGRDRHRGLLPRLGDPRAPALARVLGGSTAPG